MNDCKSYWICLSKRQQHCVGTKLQKHPGIELIIKITLKASGKKERKKKKITIRIDLVGYAQVQTTDTSILELILTGSIGPLGKTAVSSSDLLLG